MSTAEFPDPNLGQAPAPAPAFDGLISPVGPLTVPAPAPVAQPVVPPTPASAPAETPAVPVQDMRDVPLGTLIFREGLLTEEQLEEALQDGQRRGKRLGEVLLERGLVSEFNLGRLLAAQKGLQFVELDAAAVDPAAVQLLPVEKARLHSVLPLGFQDGLPVVAVADPSNELVVENVRRALNCEPHLVVAAREALHRQIELAYGALANGHPAAQAPAPAAVAAAPAAPVTAPVAQEAQAMSQPSVAPPQPVEPTLEPVQPLNGEGVWLAAPPPMTQPSPLLVAPVEPVAPEPVFVEPAIERPVEATVEPAVEQPVEPTVDPPLLLESPVQQPPAVEPVAEQPIATEQPLPAPVAINYAPVEPLAAPPVSVEPVVAAEPVAAPEPFMPVEPAAAPEAVASAPMVEAPPAQSQEPETVLTWWVVLRLSDGDPIDIGAFHSSEEAKEHAQSVVRQISSDRSWPFFDSRFIRPEAIISVDIVQPEGLWLGSAARRSAWSSAQQS